jgi:hypothetical protein
MDFSKQWIFWTLLILILLWGIATYYNAKSTVKIVKTTILPEEEESSDDALTPFFPPVKPVVGDVPRTHSSECVESKPPSTDLPIKNIPMQVALESPNMRLRNDACGIKI